MGSDDMVVDAARVSFDKVASTYSKEQNNKLINYLARNQHWSPFSHPQIQVRVTVPIFIANQLKRSTVGLSINEISRRYIDEVPTFYIPDKWRGRPDGSIKQGSSEEELTEFSKKFNYKEQHFYQDIKNQYYSFLAESRRMYNGLLDSGVAPEMARMVLPQSMNTSWIWTGSLLAFIRIYKQRIDNHSQLECQIIAKQLGEILKEYFPVSFKAWTEKV
jgi:thymidylate synthase (FAD)